MKNLIIGTAIAALTATSALAATTIEFKRDTGETVVVVLNAEGGATLPDGTQTTYTYDAEALKMCFATPDGDNCVTFAEANAEPKAGDTVRYTASDGAEGTATIVSAD